MHITLDRADLTIVDHTLLAIAKAANHDGQAALTVRFASQNILLSEMRICSPSMQGMHRHCIWCEGWRCLQ